MPILEDQLYITGYRKASQEKQKKYFDRTTYQLPNLQEGDVVRIRNSTDTAWTEKGTVKEQIDPRSFIVSTGNAKYRRTIKDILKTNEDLASYINNETELSDHENAEIEPEIVLKSPTERPNRQICRPKRLIEHC